MRILHLGKFYPPHPGGIESALAELARAQVAMGAQVMVLAHAAPGCRSTQTRRDEGVSIVEAACWGQWLYAPVSPRLPMLLAKAVRDFRPDLIHVHVPNTSAFWLLLIRSVRQLPCIVHWHADIPLESGSQALRLAYPIYRPWEQALLRHARAIVATSAAYRDSSHALTRWREKTHVIGLGLADAQVPPRRDGSSDWPTGMLRVLAVGRLSHYKGFEVLLDALTELPHVALLLIGAGEREAALRAQIAASGLSARVRLAGHVDAATLDQAYADADVFCLPSLDRAEAFGMVLLEAMRASRATLATAIPGSGVGYVVCHGETGLLVPPGDVVALRNALASLAADSALRERLGTAGRLRWSAQFTPQRVARQTLDLYRTILDKSPHHAKATRSD
ncbi:MAG: glycosyltransferase [Tahibacter sp.]